jgi:hypothetical protein
MKPGLLTLAALLVSAPATAQGVLAPGTATDSRPSTITGMASSARHCVSSDGANVHEIGWLAAGTVDSITFDANFTLVSAVSRLDLAGGTSTGAFGTPDLRSTASSAGTMALYVSGNGQAGCYRYKVEITPPAGLIPALAPNAVIDLVAETSAVVIPAAISGAAASGKHCVAGNNVANIHEIGRVEQGNQILITFESDFDPIAGATLENLSTQRGTYLVDDNSGGSLQPQLSFTASHSSTMALHVAGVAGSSGCYRYKVEIR